MNRTTKRTVIQRAIALVLCIFVVLSCEPTTQPSTPTTTAPPTRQLSIAVQGNHLIDQTGKIVQLHGVNRSGTEYGCTQFDEFTNGVPGSGEGRTVGYAVRAVQNINWKGINAIRIPLNEACWLGINGAGGPKGEYAGIPYRNFIRTMVTTATTLGIYPILDLHWSAAGDILPVSQDGAPNKDHSVQFWGSVAAMFKDNPAVIFDLYNEPRIWIEKGDYASSADASWQLYRDGGSYTDSYNNRTFYVAGTQSLVDFIRASGANNVIAVEGLGWANAADRWVKYAPKDSQILAEIHTYPSSGMNVNNINFLDGTLAIDGLSLNYPVFLGEFGEWLCNANTTGFTKITIDWANARGYSWTAWAWDSQTCNGPALVEDNDSGIATNYGIIVKKELAEYAN